LLVPEDCRGLRTYDSAVAAPARGWGDGSAIPDGVR